MFHTGNGPNTSTGNNGIVVVVLDVDVDDVEDSGDDVEDSGDDVVVGPPGIDVVVTPGIVLDVVVVVDNPSVVMVVEVDSGGSLDVGGSVVAGGSVSGGGSVVGGGSVGAGSVEGGAWAPENAQAPGAGASTAAMPRPTSSQTRERVARTLIISRPEP